MLSAMLFGHQPDGIREKIFLCIQNLFETTAYYCNNRSYFQSIHTELQLAAEILIYKSRTKQIAFKTQIF